MLWAQITTFMVGIRRPRAPAGRWRMAQPRTSFEWPGMTHPCSHHIDLPEHPLLLQLCSHALANVSSQNQATAKPVTPTAGRVSDQTPSSPFPQGRGSKKTLQLPPPLLCDLCCSMGCSRTWQRSSRHPFSIRKRVFLCKPAQLLLLQGKRQREKWVSH